MDANGVRKEEIKFLAGEVSYRFSFQPSAFSNFLDKVSEAEALNQRIKDDYNFSYTYTVDDVFDLELEKIAEENIFSFEEQNGNCVEMTDLFLQFKNLKAVQEANLQFDYLTYLGSVTSFNKLSINQRKSLNYKLYLEQLLAYLKSLYIRTHPLTDSSEIFDEISYNFENCWRLGKLKEYANYLEGPSEEAKETTLYCVFCDQLFVHQSNLQHHLSGKKHKKRMENQMIAGKSKVVT